MALWRTQTTANRLSRVAFQQKGRAGSRHRKKGQCLQGLYLASQQEPPQFHVYQPPKPKHIHQSWLVSSCTHDTCLALVEHLVLATWTRLHGAPDAYLSLTCLSLLLIRSSYAFLFVCQKKININIKRTHALAYVCQKLRWWHHLRQSRQASFSYLMAQSPRRESIANASSARFVTFTWKTWWGAPSAWLQHPYAQMPQPKTRITFGLANKSALKHWFPQYFCLCKLQPASEQIMPILQNILWCSRVRLYCLAVTRCFCLTGQRPTATPPDAGAHAHHASSLAECVGPRQPGSPAGYETSLSGSGCPAQDSGSV